MTPLRFDVLGTPAPQGSKSRMPNGAVVEGRSTAQRQRHKAWRTAVAEKAREVAEEHGALTGPVELHLTFRFVRPKSWPKRRSHWFTPAPDLDKLLRSTCDGLADGGLIANDSRVVSVLASKIAVPEGWTGAQVVMWALEE